MKSTHEGKYLSKGTRTASSPSPKSGEKPKQKKSTTKRKLVLALAIVAALVLTVYVLATIFIQPPKIETPDTVPPSLEDGTEPNIKPADAAKRKEEYFTFLICGVDEDKTRTDTMMVVSYDVKNGHINVVNVPRDTLVDNPSVIKKINNLYGRGIESTKQGITDLLGIPIDRYAIVDFDGFEELVDAIGGVNYDVPVRMKYDDPTQDLHIDLQPGPQLLNGKKALHFVRFRKMNKGVKGGYPEGDVGRIHAQQEFIKAVIKQMASPANILKINDIAKVASENLKTDMSISEMAWFALRVVKLNTENITMEMLPGEAQYLYEPAYGEYQSYYVADYDATLSLVNSDLNPYLKPITKLKHRDVNQYKKQSGNNSSGSSGNSSNSGSSTTKPDTTPDTKPDTTPDTKPDTKPDTTPDTKPEDKPTDNTPTTPEPTPPTEPTPDPAPPLEPTPDPTPPPAAEAIPVPTPNPA